jgi:hypothetical protein
VEGFLAYTSGCSESANFQVKGGKVLPGKVMDTNVINGGSFLFRSRVVAKLGDENKKEGWTLVLPMPRRWFPDSARKKNTQGNSSI